VSESIAEMVIPGTYIEVRAEGLIGVGGITTGNVGVVGSAAKGPVNKPIMLGSYSDAIDAFGVYDSAAQASGGPVPLTLVRAIEQAFKGGASTVFGVRVANGTPVKAKRLFKDSDGADAFTLTAMERDAEGSIITAGGTWGNQISVTIGPDGTGSKLTLTYRNRAESYSGTAEEIRAAIAKSSQLVEVTTDAAAAKPLEAIATPAPLGIAGAGNAVGDDVSSLTAIEFKAGLEALVDQPINIVLVGNHSSTLDLKGTVAEHLETTENQGRERIALIGAMAPGSATDVSGIAGEAATVTNDRIVLVTPGVVYTDPGTRKPYKLQPSYLAAAVAGKLASQAPHISLTNKALDIDGVSVVYGAPATKTLLGLRTLVVRPKFGYQVVKGITTDDGAFTQISVRRIVDYAKAGVRKGSDPYIGRLNNARVRAALKATLDGFLSQMVLDEMLVEYELAVTATRSQEIAGVCAVAMTLKPTFSIDYIRVTMTLQ